jgi:hypothetical protein
VLLALVVVAVVASCKAFDGGWVGSATKTQIPKVAACAWVGAVPAVAPKGCMLALAVTLAWAKQAIKTGGDMVVVEP